MIWLVLANSWEYYYFWNYYKNNMFLQWDAITTELYPCSDPLLLPKFINLLGASTMASTV